MKFGRNLPRNQVPEWSSSYINYKGLKKLIKSATEASKHGESVDLAGFFYTLDRNLEDVETFYNKKFAESSRRLKLLQKRYGRSPDLPEGIDRDEIEDLMGALLELRAQLRKLQWYGEVNRRGFIKITKKLDKKIPSVCAQRRYLESRVDPTPFATNSGLSEDMQTVNDWLSALGEFKLTDDAVSVNSSHSSIKRVSSRAMLHLPMELLDTVDQAIRSDDASTISELLLEFNTATDEDDPDVFQKLLLNLLQRSISCRAKACVDLMLGKLHSLDEDDDINDRNCIHRLVIAIARTKPYGESDGETDIILDNSADATSYVTPAAAPMLAPPSWTSREHDRTNPSGQMDEPVMILEHLLHALKPHQRQALLAKDTYGRRPLHYAAQFGFVPVCDALLQYMRRWGQIDAPEVIESETWQDSEGWAPLHLSIIGGHPLTTKALLEAANQTHPSSRKALSRSGEALALATKANFVVIVKLLVESGIDINYQDEQGETALHVAARFGHEECARILLEGAGNQKADTELAEQTFAWTPLFVASVDGHLEIVELLIKAGAELGKSDLSGWTAKEHAALRGHINIARRLAAITPPETSGSDASVAAVPLPTPSSIEDRKSQSSASGNGTVRTLEPVKTFGHRYLKKESMVLVSLGTMDQRKNVEAVRLDRIPLSDAHSTQLDTALSVVVSAHGANGEPSIIDLPVQENISTEPIVFTALDAAKVKLLFDIVPTYAGSKDKIVGRGVALLSTVRPTLGTKKMNIQGDVSVPIMAANTLDVIGTVHFNFLIITPFTHPNLSIAENQTYWKSMTSTMLIGHRGLGKNLPSRKSLQLGENTIQSFIAAANLGASYVEFLHVNDGQPPRASRPTSPVQPIDAIGVVSEANGRRSRSLSVGHSDQSSASDLSERMKHTRDFKMKGYKANSRGNFIQAPFTTLEEMFKKLPETIGFNIEMKYPMLHESEEHEMDTYAVELNSFVDTVLTKVYDLVKKRNVIFSSFNPDICLLLSFKQPSIPILFLTDAGIAPVGDIRASSLQEGIRFASRWNLLGVVTAAEPLVISPRLVKVVKGSGLVCVSYGVINNDPEKVQLQVKEGIDAVIVDSVLAIRKGLTGGSSKPASNGSAPPNGSA
ncbi:MAG: Glycerophosphocholine phosphodiesterase [Thelocarpon impressellum]|nr:MAG: Glycerophosphocholine phosphodiesterase [Thelocarpon impressellum]